LKEPHLILGIGELLWDLLPEGPQLGGAPANFAVMAGRLGNHAVVLSRIGRDDLGRNAMELLNPLPADASFLQVDPAHETGRVTVAFEAGSRTTRSTSGSVGFPGAFRRVGATASGRTPFVSDRWRSARTSRGRRSRRWQRKPRPRACGCST